MPWSVHVCVIVNLKHYKLKVLWREGVLRVVSGECKVSKKTFFHIFQVIVLLVIDPLDSENTLYLNYQNDCPPLSWSKGKMPETLWRSMVLVDRITITCISWIERLISLEDCRVNLQDWKKKLLFKLCFVTLTDAARSNIDAKRIKVDDNDEGEELAISVR